MIQPTMYDYHVWGHSEDDDTLEPNDPRWQWFDKIVVARDKGEALEIAKQFGFTFTHMRAGVMPSSTTKIL